MRQFHKNPRQITTKQYSDLEIWLKKYGDLSGVIHDLNSDQVIGGNQRSRIFNINECKIVMLEEYPQPDEQGTVGWGFIIWQGKKYSYRQVRWTEEVCDQANIIANKAGGTFDFDILANQFDLSLVLASGFTEKELQIDSKSTGNLLSLVGITLDEPKHKVNHGDIWRVGKHILICAEVMTEWSRWLKYLETDIILATYPGPLVPMAQLAENKRILMVQPNSYIAGHILDHYSEIFGEEQINYDSNGGIEIQSI